MKGKARADRKAGEPWSDDEVLALVRDCVSQGRELRRPFEAEWVLCLAFLTGQQYSYFNSAAHSLQILERVRGRERVSDNLLLSRWRRQVADLLLTDPVMSVVPETAKDVDVKAAKVGNKVLK